MHEMVKQTGSWLKSWGLNLIMTILLGTIAWGGKVGIDLIREFVKEQKEINIKQQEFNAQISEKSAIQKNNCEINREIIQAINETNLEQGQMLLQHGEQIIENKTNIRNLLNNL